MSSQSSNRSSSSTNRQNWAGGSKKKEIYKYESPFMLYAMDWSVRPGKPFRLALGSFIEEYANRVQVIYLNEEIGDFVEQKSFSHPYPTTKLAWIPDPHGQNLDLLATSGDYLRIWRVHEDNEITNECSLNSFRYQSLCAPLTSFDWNETDPTIIATSSIDTTCTVWSIETQQPIASTASAPKIVSQQKTQLIAHDCEVYDVAFSHGSSGREIFATLGNDGSMRMFDLRHLMHSMIMYEDPNRSPLLRLAWNKQDPYHIAALADESSEVVILDTRKPTLPVARLKNHRGFVNGMAWAPHSSCHISTAADDCQALIWDIQPRDIEDPILAYTAAGEINQIKWSSAQPEWIAICYNNCLELLRV
ncbi:ddb1 and cul4 associated factor 7 [Cichlidogyrus casuarinus]|uniref:Ddb1 and cul4 associated factor 7 n=1 Tax=Cichlidogyrus casuarinus TaxID=1844966 RepID=A0ABD2Q079_9PLAT